GGGRVGGAGAGPARGRGTRGAPAPGGGGGGFGPPPGAPRRAGLSGASPPPRRCRGLPHTEVVMKLTRATVYAVVAHLARNDGGGGAPDRRLRAVCDRVAGVVRAGLGGGSGKDRAGGARGGETGGRSPPRRG